MLVERRAISTDPAVMSKVIAQSILRDLSSDKQVDARGIQNMLRLLQMYRTGSFRAHQSRGILKRDQHVSMIGSRSASGLKRLRAALVSVHHSISPQLSEEAFASTQNLSLLKLMEPSEAAASEDRAMATRDAMTFLKALTESLS